MSSVDDNDQDPEAGENASSANDSNDTGSYVSQESGSKSGGFSRNQSASKNMSLGFLAEDFGGRRKWSWLPWGRKSNYHARFKETILSGGGSSAVSSKSWHARYCPCFSTDVKKQNEFVHEMRVLARLRHPCITTVLGAVISNSHDPMLVSKYLIQKTFAELIVKAASHFDSFLYQWNTWSMAPCQIY
jgi:serine/threonine protein kinase